MLHVMGGLNEPSQPDEEITVCMIVPEEFAGWSMSELQSRQGCIADMEVKHGSVSAHATLPASALAGQVEAIEVGTQGRGRVNPATGQ